MATHSIGDNLIFPWRTMQIAPPSVDCNLRHVVGELFIDTTAALLFAASRSECEKEESPGSGKVTAMAIHLPVPFK